MKKALSAPAIHFKGSGWAKKDARSAPTSPAAATQTGADGGTAAGEGTGRRLRQRPTAPAAPVGG